MMTLKRFRVTNFRSIIDSGWIDCDDVTSLIGINESGKSNMILALWKLNPVRDGEIDPLHDMPVKQYSSWRLKPNEIEFISADFELSNELIDKIVGLCNCDREAAVIVNIGRKYNGEISVFFPNYKKGGSIEVTIVSNLVSEAMAQLKGLNEKTKAEAGIKDNVSKAYENILSFLSVRETLTYTDLNEIEKQYPLNTNISASSEIHPHFLCTQKSIQSAFSKLKPANPTEYETVQNLVKKEMPSFVYYSNYGNLDAQIYLPHAVKWLNNEEVVGIDYSDKVRTLRVLFDFVKLNPQEVLELGKDPRRIVEDRYGQITEQTPTDEEIAEATEQKAERAILLNSASSDLTRQFREWWKQGNYIFRFHADGEFFKIWVSDDKRAEEIELERRSTGLQWFLSFFLVFLVESKEAHKGAILLLDEAGLTLHPLAQKDLTVFFDNLAKTNQIIYTTHSPFLVDTSNIDRAKVIYSDDDGLSIASSDLRASDDKLNEKSVYAAHAALGLSVADVLLHGCQPIIVEGASDQYYLNAVKLYLIRNKKYVPTMELVFMPSGGVRGVSGIVSIVCGKEGELPLVVLDSDESGNSAKSKLLSGLYSHNRERIIDIGKFVDVENGEIEDLFPIEIMHRQINRLFRDIEEEAFEDIYVSGEAIVSQIEQFAAKHNKALEKGWKVEIAKGVKQQLLKSQADSISDTYLSKWKALFKSFNL